MLNELVMLLNRIWQTALFLIGMLLMIGVQKALALDVWHQILILAPAVALLGLPHGALDPSMAEVLWPFRGAIDRALFFAGYIAIAASVGLLWWLAPGVGLALFLAYSAFHFAGDWQDDGFLWRCAGGLSVIGAPALLHEAEVTTIFAALGPTASASDIAQATAWIGWTGLAMTIVATARSIRPIQITPAFELAGLWIGAMLLPPLLFFTVYFCLLHSLRHLTATLAVLPGRSRALWHAGGILILSLSGAGLGLASLVYGNAENVEGSVLKVVFIGLAALTVPHMLLVERFHGARRYVANGAIES